MSSFWNKEDRLDREFQMLREQREREENDKQNDNNENEKLKKEIINLKKQNTRLNNQIDELKMSMLFFKDYENKTQYYENIYKEAMVKYFHDYQNIVKNDERFNEIFKKELLE